MTDRPLSEPMPPDPELDRVDEGVEGDTTEVQPTESELRPSAAEGAEPDGGPRPPRPSQAEGDRDESAG